MSDKLEKQKAFLAKYITFIDRTLNEGIPVLKYFNCPEAEAEETKLQQYREVLEQIPSKDKLKEALTGLETTTMYLVYLYNEYWINIEKVKVFNDEHVPQVNKAQMDYANKVAKSLEAKQKRAPGFDGQGGGMSRRSEK